jgi:hypothetical protein
MWNYIDYREAMGSLGFGSEEDVRNEMAMDAELDVMHQYFGDDLPEEWQDLLGAELLEKWLKYKKDHCLLR